MAALLVDQTGVRRIDERNPSVFAALAIRQRGAATHWRADDLDGDARVTAWLETALDGRDYADLTYAELASLPDC